MGQIRVAKDVYEKLDDKAKESRKIWANNTFLNEPAFDEATQEYVWDDPRINDEHSFVMEECKALKPKKADKEEDLRVAIEEKLRTRKVGELKPADVIVDDPLVVKPN